MGVCQSSPTPQETEKQEEEEEEETEKDAVYVVEDDEAELYSPGGATKLVSIYSKQGKKGPNQDAAILRQGYGGEDGVFCGVFDGHGRKGHYVSKVVRDYLPSLVLTQRNALLSNDSLAESSDDGYGDDDGDADDDSDEDDLCSSSASEMFDEWKEACVGAFKAMDKELIHRLPFGCSSSGSTAVTIIKMGSDVIIANLGDSRAVLGTMLDSGQLTAVQLTTDLKPGLPHEAKRIRKRNGRVFALKDEPNIQRVWLPNSNYPGLAMARAFGDLQLKDYGVIAVPQVSYHHLHDNDRFIVLATDGVWDVLSNQQVVSIIGSVEKKENAAHAVVAMAGQLWKQKFPTSKVDDCTVLCFFLHEMEDI